MLQGGGGSAKGGPKHLEGLFWSTKTTFEAPKVPLKCEKYNFFIEKINI